MDVRLTTLSTNELEALEDLMSQCTLWLRACGKYSAAASAKSLGAEASQTLIARVADQRDSIARQLSLTPPSTYERF